MQRPYHGVLRVYPRVCGGTLEDGIPGGTPVRSYPRVCGGTSSTTATTRDCPGLSPRVRGNPRLLRRAGDAWRSIPACAGEPELDDGRDR